jgi:uncharacterized membrane protein
MSQNNSTEWVKRFANLFCIIIEFIYRITSVDRYVNKINLHPVTLQLSALLMWLALAHVSRLSKRASGFKPSGSDCAWLKLYIFIKSYFTLLWCCLHDVPVYSCAVMQYGILYNLSSIMMKLYIHSPICLHGIVLN